MTAVQATNYLLLPVIWPVNWLKIAAALSEHTPSPTDTSVAQKQRLLLRFLFYASTAIQPSF